MKKISSQIAQYMKYQMKYEIQHPGYTLCWTIFSIITKIHTERLESQLLEFISIEIQEKKQAELAICS